MRTFGESSFCKSSMLSFFGLYFEWYLMHGVLVRAIPIFLKNRIEAVLNPLFDYKIDA